MRRRFWGALVVAGGALTAGGASWAWQQVLLSPEFGLAEVEVLGCDRLTAAQVRARVPVEQGVNLFTIELAEVEAAVEELPWVIEARAERRPPETLRVKVVEYTPRALVALGEMYWVSPNGRIFAPYRVGEAIDVPIVLGLEREGYERGDLRTTRRLRVALEFLDAWGEALPRPRSVEVGAGDVLRYEGPDGVAVVLGPPPFQAALVGARQAERNLTLGEGDVIFVGRDRRQGRVVVRTAPPSDGGL